MYGPQNYFLTNNELYALLSLHQVRLQAKKNFPCPAQSVPAQYSTCMEDGSKLDADNLLYASKLNL